MDELEDAPCTVKILRYKLRYLEIRLEEERWNTDYERARAEIWASAYIKLEDEQLKMNN